MTNNMTIDKVCASSRSITLNEGFAGTNETLYFNKYKSKKYINDMINECRKYNPDLDRISLLITLIDNINFVDIHGNTCIINATIVNNLKVIKLLVDAGADIYVHNKLNESAMTLAALYGYIDIIEYLYNNGYKDINEAFNCASHSAVYKYLYNHGANINNAIIIATKQNNIEKVKFLIDKGADVNIVQNITFTNNGASFDRNNGVVAVQMNRNVTAYEIAKPEIKTLLRNNGAKTHNLFGFRF